MLPTMKTVEKYSTRLEKATRNKKGEVLNIVPTRWRVYAEHHDGSITLIDEGIAPTRNLARRSALSSKSRYAYVAGMLPATVSTPGAATLLGVDVKTIRSWEKRGFVTRLPGNPDAPVTWRLADLLACEAARQNAGTIPHTSISWEVKPGQIPVPRKPRTAW